MDADGCNKRQITDLGVAAFGPFFHPSGEKIIFSSNHGDPSGREFELFMVDLDGGNLEQITFAGGFDGFPMFAPDGETFVFCSNRNNTRARRDQRLRDHVEGLTIGVDSRRSQFLIAWRAARLERQPCNR